MNTVSITCQKSVWEWEFKSKCSLQTVCITRWTWILSLFYKLHFLFKTWTCGYCLILNVWVICLEKILGVFKLYLFTAICSFFFFWSPHPYFSCINVNLNSTSQLSEMWNQSQSFSICICPTLETVFQWTWLLFYSDTGFLRVGYLKIYQILRKTKTMKCWNRAVGGEFGPRNRFYSMVSVIDISRSKSCL